MKSIIALYATNAREFSRDRMAGLFTIIMPVMFAAFFGMVFDGGDNQLPHDVPVRHRLRGPTPAVVP
ncbi:MAG: hypothetical protein Q8O86_01300, partial [Dehalococcoidia bacterium]|nr:hypothetical protein [Dehalococcoidia bacterium]